MRVYLKVSTNIGVQTEHCSPLLEQLVQDDVFTTSALTTLGATASFTFSTTFFTAFFTDILLI